MTTQPVELYQVLAERYSIPIELVKEIIEFFYKDGVKADKANMVNKEIYVTGLGSFEVKEYRAKHFLRNLTAKIENEESYQTDKFKIIQANIARIIDQIDEIKKEKTEFNDVYRKTSRDISEPKEDLGRSQEQTI